MTKSTTRTTIAIALFIPLAAILLTTLACLPAPIGDPDQSKIDDKFTGVWQAADPKNDENLIVLMRPWDKHTYYLVYMTYKKEPAAPNAAPGAAPQQPAPAPQPDAGNHLHFKAWLTHLGDATFLTAEPLDNLDYAFGPSENKDNDKPWWMVGRVDLKDGGGTITFKPIDEKSWIVKDLTTREKLEAAIKAQADNKELYTNDPMTFKKLTKENAKIVEEALKQNHIGG